MGQGKSLPVLFFVVISSASLLTKTGSGCALRGVHQSVHKNLFLAVMLALKWIGGTGRVVFHCKTVVAVVAALRARKRLPEAKQF